MSDKTDDEDFKRMMLEFRSSAMGEFDRFDKRFGGLEGRMESLEGNMRDLQHEFRQRTLTMETAILNSIRDLSRSMDRRFEQVDRRLDRLENPDPPV
ncbi:hypothetical protein [Euzebya tangerina]|uniref:hypothetical protein n=1 Tax=Euzebya tangerina TaxID=591198 RepID=UPI000E30F0F0|nr:hypothetical protein [Euzebya tangerina]